MNDVQLKKIYSLFQKYPKISTDTRLDIRESIFFALKGENFDGNKFADSALNKGALLAVVSDPRLKHHKNCIFVEDTLNTLQNLALYHRKQLKTQIVAITGSNGKTTTKELIFRVLSCRYKCFATPGNLNNLIGVPLSILKINNNHDIAVIEIGANHIEENEVLTNICLPDYGLTTNIGKDHLGEFGGMKQVIKAYKEFIDYFQNTEAKYTFFLNRDDLNLVKLTEGLNIISFGECTDLKISKTIHCCGKSNMDNHLLKVKIKSNFENYYEDELIINSNLFGSFNLANILAAVCMGQYFKVPNNEIKEAIENYYPENNRSQVIEWKSNHIILDAYNANPTSMELALYDFNKLGSRNKVVILGNMNELGKYSPIEHKNIVNLLKTLNFTKIILIGLEFGKIKDSINCLYFKNVYQLREWLKLQTFEETFFLVKGSRGEQLEKAFEISDHDIKY